MRHLLFYSIFLAGAVTVSAADPEVGKTLDAVAAYAGRLEPILQQARPAEWVAKGAPDTYVAQFQSSLEQCKAVNAEARQVAQHPENLSEFLALLFRIQSLEITSGSLEDGMRRYQNPALAELLSGTRAENTQAREKLQLYALDLAREQQQQYQLVDKEAQRCRQSLSGPAAKPKK